MKNDLLHFTNLTNTRTLTCLHFIFNENLEEINCLLHIILFYGKFPLYLLGLLYGPGLGKPPRDHDFNGYNKYMTIKDLCL